MKKLILVSGYSGSGKTTLKNQIDSYHPEILTTASSDLLTKTTLDYFGIEVNKEATERMNRKKQEDETWFQDSLNSSKTSRFFSPKSIRAAKVFVAEDVIVPMKSRSYFASYIVGEFLGSSCDIVLGFTTIPAEQSRVISNLKSIEWLVAKFEFHCVNLIGEQDNPDVDAREHWKGDFGEDFIDFQNPMDYTLLDKFLHLVYDIL